jgi:nitrite reductase/ring-hydroxylating ferredoxin subunit
VNVVRVAALAELTPGAPRLAVADDTRLVLVRVGDEVLASYRVRVDGGAVWVEVP